MPVYKIHRLRESQQQHFRSAAHTSGLSQVKLKDYSVSGEVEAESPYAAWVALKDTEDAIRVGDLLEAEDGTLRICKYIGFEEAQWFVPEPKPVPADSSGAAPGQPGPAAAPSQSGETA